MSFKKIISVGLVSLTSIGIFCLNNEDPVSPPNNNNNKALSSYGTFKVQLIPEVTDPGSENPARVKVLGTVNDGPTPPENAFKVEMTSGSCKLMKVVTPDCPECQLGYRCVEGDSCMREPTKIDVGTVTVEGLKSSGAPKKITMVPPSSLYYQMTGVKLDYPPCSEGETITLSATGKDSVAPFTIKARGIAPLVVLSPDGIPSEDGKDVTIQWEPAAVKDVSKIYVVVDVSYHGGCKGQIQAECEDNGSLTIPGAMLDKLKSYGLAGFPRVVITRKSVAYDEISKASVVFECEVVRLLAIPGVTSCGGDDQCPGKACIDKRCQ